MSKPTSNQDTGKDRHHLCFIARRWKTGYLAELRKFHYCIILIPRNSLHRLIHEYVGCVPPPSGRNAKDALEQLRMLERYGAISDDDSIEKRLEVLAALFDCCEQPTADAFRRQLEVAHRFYHKPSI